MATMITTETRLYPEAAKLEADQPEPEQEERAASSKDEIDQSSNFFSSFFQLLRFEIEWVDIGLILLGTICAAGSGVPFPIIGLIFGQLVDDLNASTCQPSTSASDTNERVLTIVYTGVAALVLIFVYITCWSLFSQRLAHRLRDRYFDRLLRKEPSVFDDTNYAGIVSTRLHGDIQAVQSGTCEKIGTVISCIAFFITAFTIAFTRLPRLAGMLSSVIPAFLLMGAVGNIFTMRYSTQLSKALEPATAVASEALSSITLVQVMGSESRLESRFASNMLLAYKAGIGKAVVAAVQAGMVYFIAYSANALAFWQGSREIAVAVENPGSGATMGEIYTVVFVIIEACIFLGTMAPILSIIGNGVAAFIRLKSEMDAPSTAQASTDDGTGVDEVNSTNAIELKNVSFEYSSRPGQKVLRDVSIEFPSGKHTAIVGSSGSGKSTIASLMLRLYEPSSGTIYYNGVDIKNHDLHSLRSKFGVVQQDAGLLERSIQENIALGLVGMTTASHHDSNSIDMGVQVSEFQEKIEESDTCRNARTSALVRKAAGLADAHDFIKDLPAGYDTSVGPDGNQLSGGQKQRVALARAFIRDPSILLLDEATSALDSATEARILSAVESFKTSDRTVISITHRLSAIRNADHVIVIGAGQVLETGTYQDLVQRGGALTRMIEMQNVNGNQDTIQSRSDIPQDKAADLLEIPTAKELGLLSRLHSPQSVHSAQSQTIQNGNQDQSLGDKSSWTVATQLGWLIKPSRLWLFYGFCASLLVGATFSAAGLIFGHTVEALGPCTARVSEILSKGRLFGGMMFLLAAVELFANFASWSSFGIFTEKLLYRMRVLTFRSMLEQQPVWHQQQSPAELLAVITKDTTAISVLSGSIIGTILSILIGAVVGIILSHIVAWNVAVVCLATMPLLLIAGFLQIRMQTRLEEKSSEAFGDAVRIAAESVKHIKTVALYSLEDEVLGKYRSVLANQQGSISALRFYTNLCLSVSVTIGLFIYALVYWWGSRLITRGETSPSQFFTVLVAMVISAQLWGQAFVLAPDISRALAAARQINELLGIGSTKTLSPDLIHIQHPVLERRDVEANLDEKFSAIENSHGLGIEFHNVDFSYTEEARVLHNISFKLSPGMFCGIVGHSGAGKSTLLQLLQRIYEPTSGTITIDGRNMLQTSIKTFRNDIAIVPQGYTLFDGSIRFNVSLGTQANHEPTESEIEDACKLANIHDTIMALPERYDTECGPQGSRLSGGQKQRLAIARALIRKPKLLLLDESTSALDVESEQLFQSNLMNNAFGMTVVAISHRIHTLERADIIFVMDKGRMIASGTHSELLESSRIYRASALEQGLA